MGCSLIVLHVVKELVLVVFEELLVELLVEVNLELEEGVIAALVEEVSVISAFVPKLSRFVLHLMLKYRNNCGVLKRQTATCWRRMGLYCFSVTLLWN